MLSTLKPALVLGLFATPLFLAACQTTGQRACSERGLQPDTPEYSQCVDTEYGKTVKRVRNRAHKPGGGGS